MDDGGPAFPVDVHPTNIDKVIRGMSLRDYIACAALTLGEGVWEGKGDEPFAEMAKSCYRIADAMLAERAKGQA